MPRAELGKEDIERLKLNHYRHNCEWRNHILVKSPADMTLYSTEIFRRKPDYIIETGTAFGGSALFFADMLSLFNPTGRVITIDIDAEITPVHDLITCLKGSSVDPVIVDKVRSMVSGAVMVVLDSSHRARHVAREIAAYSPMVTSGQFLVVEDCWRRRGQKYIKHWPKVAMEKFIGETKLFSQEPIWERFGEQAGSTRDGWLLRV